MLFVVDRKDMLGNPANPSLTAISEYSRISLQRGGDRASPLSSPLPKALLSMSGCPPQIQPNAPHRPRNSSFRIRAGRTPGPIATGLRFLCAAFLFWSFLSLSAPRAESASKETEPAPPEPSGPIVSGIEWSGLTVFSEADLEKKILTTAEPRLRLRFWKARRRLDRFDLDEDTERILSAYREAGYFAAALESRVQPVGEDRVVVQFALAEGQPMQLESWQLALVSSESEPRPITEAEEQRVMQQLPTADTERFGAGLYREIREALMTESAEMGFPHARLKGGASVDPETNLASVDWTLELGPRTFFGPIDIEGLTQIDREVVLRELRFEPGEPFAPSKLEASERKLIQTGLFRSVAIGRGESGSSDESQEEAAELATQVRVEESPLRSLRGSIGYGTEDGPRGEVSLVWRNFLGDARRLQARGFGSLLDAGFEASLGQPYIWGERGRGDFAVSALRQSRPGYEAFVSGSTGLLTLYLDRGREGPWSLQMGPGFELAQILEFQIDSPEDERGPRQSLISTWYTAARYQRVDDPLNPRSGLRAELGSEVGGRYVGSDLDYHRWELDLRAYLPVGPLVWAMRASATTLDPIGQNIGDVPLTRRLYSGGTNSVRGFGFQKLGPEDSRNDPTGGLSRLEVAAELRIPVWGRLGLIGFVDAGDVSAASWNWRPTELRAAAGPGLRIDTPVGPLRFDFAFLLNRPRNTDPFRFHLSVGQAF